MPTENHLVAGTASGVETSNRVFFPALDGLRGVAFLLVFLYHYDLLALGWVGVDCFFVLSGFLITGILFDSMNAPDRMRSFYLRRALRIFPLYYGVFFAILLLSPLAHWTWTATWLLWPAYLTNWIGFFHPGSVSQATMDAINGTLYTRSGTTFYLGHLWSLCVEEQFYLFWPSVVFYVGSRRALLWICSVALVLCPLFRVLAFTILPSGWLSTGVLYHSTPFRIDTLLVGAAAALLYRGPGRERLVALARPCAWGAAVLGLLILDPRIFLGAPSEILLAFGFSLIALLSAAVILRTLTPRSRLYRLFSLSPLRWLGRISYGAYVFHDIPHSLYIRLAQGNRAATASIALIGTMSLAGVSYRFFEAPLLRLRSR